MKASPATHLHFGHETQVSVHGKHLILCALGTAVWQCHCHPRTKQHDLAIAIPAKEAVEVSKLSSGVQLEQEVEALGGSEDTLQWEEEAHA